MRSHQQFALVSKTYTDGISLQKDGPRIKKEFGSELSCEAGRTYRTSATFVPKLVPKLFVTTLTVADELTTHYECVAFQTRTVMRDFSETTNVFLPKEAKTRYCSSLFYDPRATTKCYVVGTELIPGKKFVVEPASNFDEGESDATEWKEINGDISGDRSGVPAKERGTFVATQTLDITEGPTAHYREHCVVNCEKGQGVFHAIQWACEVAHPAA